MAVIEGSAGDVLVGSTALKVREWSANHSADELEITNKTSSGYQEFQLGIERLEGSFSADWHNNIDGTSGLPPYASVKPQESVSMTLQIGDSTATGGEPAYTFTAILSGLEITSATEGKIEYTGNFKSSGTITHTVNS